MEEIILLVVLGLAIAWIVWAVHYIRTDYPIDRRLQLIAGKYTRR